MIYLYLLLLQFTLVHCSGPQLKTNKASTPFDRSYVSSDVDYTLSCDAYVDCFNCTISNCNWNQDGCNNKGGQDTDSRSLPTLETIFSMKCEDTLNICYTSVPTSANTGKQLQFGINFDTVIPDDTIPANYWCKFSFDYQYASIVRLQETNELTPSHQFLKSSVKNSQFYEYSNYQIIEEFSLIDEQYIVNGNPDNLENEYIMLFLNRTVKAYTFMLELRVIEILPEMAAQLLDPHGPVIYAYGFVGFGLLIFLIIFGCVYLRNHKAKQQKLRETPIDVQNIEQSHIYTWDKRHYQDAVMEDNRSSSRAPSRATFLGHNMSQISEVPVFGGSRLVSEVNQMKNDYKPIIKPSYKQNDLDEQLLGEQLRNEDKKEEEDFVMQYMDPVKTETINIIIERKKTLNERRKTQQKKQSDVFEKQGQKADKEEAKANRSPSLLELIQEAKEKMKPTK